MADPHSPLNLEPVAPQAYRAMLALDAAARRLIRERRLIELVKLRASQLNGCAYCIQLHAGAARRAGEHEQRLDAVAAWRESPCFDERERAALALCDALTALPPDGLAAAEREAHRRFDEDELAGIVWAIVTINAWNRVALAVALTPRAVP